MWRKWFPWRNIVKAVAQKKGFLDPVELLAKLQRFAQPSEVAAPIELLRLATVLQARGLVNVQAIQHNLDWVWPYWVVRQFDPRDVSFIPRAFSLTHINLTNRNWTAVGVPDCPHYPLVDPRGLLTPFYDGWSLDVWIIPKRGKALLPSRASEIDQRWEKTKPLVLRTRLEREGLQMNTRVSMESYEAGFACIQEIEAVSDQEAWLVAALRPFNAEGVSDVEHLSITEDQGWEINKKQHVLFDQAPERHFLSNYREGDVFGKISGLPGISQADSESSTTECSAGMATAAAVFALSAGALKKVKVTIPLQAKLSVSELKSKNDELKPDSEQSWNLALADSCDFRCGDEKTVYIYEAALKTLLLHTPGLEAFPGPYTYKHFWFRDAVYILHALLAVNLPRRAERILDHFPARQVFGGHFRSQDGEWDSNGQVLWIFRRYCELTGLKPKDAWKDSIVKGTRWIEHKRTSEKSKEEHAGLFPAGFSAEHLGPNDFYYWDDFWGVEGLRSASVLLELYGDKEEAEQCLKMSEQFMACIEKSLARTAARLQTRAMPSSPYRRLDTGSVGSLAVGYPLDLWKADDPRVIETVEYLLKHHFINGGFFHEMSHSGINPYLTLGIAQILLRRGDPRFAELVKAIQKLASPTGQWPEAIHPQTGGGCMGDGQHVWAAAEWVLMIRSCFVREEKDRLILCPGVLTEWVRAGQETYFGKTMTPWGLLEVRIKEEKEETRVAWTLEGSRKPAVIEIRLPGYVPAETPGNQTGIIQLKRNKT